MTPQSRTLFSLFAALGLAVVVGIDPASAATQRNWTLGQFTSVNLVPREKGATDNQHPAAWSAELLRRQLGAVRADVDGQSEPLFHPGELETLAEPLSQALAEARPEDDLLLLSTHRRGGPFFVAPSGLTARLFVQNGSLQLIVHDARLDYYNKYLGSKVVPTFTFGSRDKPGNAVLQGATAANQRKDWVSISAAAPAAIGSPGVAPVLAPSEAATRVPRSRDAGLAEEIEQRLLTLKRLFDRGLITEAEYQQKRKEVLQLL